MLFKKEELIKSPLNYTGGKFKLLPQLLPLFPNEIDTFVDLFGGGFNVGINVKANNIIYNELEFHVYDFMNNISKMTGNEAKSKIMENINRFELSKTNAEGFKQCREAYNLNNSWDLFYSVVSHAFNYQIRYNKKGEYNMPFGKNRSSFNTSLQDKFIRFVDKVNANITNIEFLNGDFSIIKNINLNSDDLVYCDPPYLITLASYNESNGWNEDKEKDLLSTLDYLNKNNIKFALSNVLEHKGKSNKILLEWASQYNIHFLNKDYKNCSYHGKNNNNKTIEVLITNY